ncbi:MAG TPA: 3-hydroxylacyl-ACP dehydratase [Methylibium sp.]
MLDHAWIAAHIPHQGSMCLLDGVAQWSESEIVCTASSHRRLDNPLRSANRLGIATGIEYAAQAMAVHGALLSAEAANSTQGYLASARDVSWQVLRLDDIEGPLSVRAERLSGNASNILYQFSLQGEGRTLLTGRATVILNTATPP